MVMFAVAECDSVTFSSSVDMALIQLFCGMEMLLLGSLSPAVKSYHKL
jgi:hypothetical protein